MDNIISNPDEKTIWELAQTTDEKWTIKNGSNYLACSGTDNYAVLTTTVSNDSKWTASGSETYEFVNVSNSRNLRRNGTYGFACYSTSTGDALSLYKRQTTTGGTRTDYYFTSDGSEPIYTVTAESSDNAHGTVSVLGSKITAVPAVGYKVSGYTVNPLGVATVTDNLDGTFTVNDLTADVTVKIIFEKLQVYGYYVKVDGELSDWSGDYLIVYEDGNVAFNGGLDTLDTLGYANNTIPVSIENGKIAKTDVTREAQFTVMNASDDEYTIQSASGLYIGKTADSNGLDAKTDKQYTNKFDFNGNINIIGSGGAYLRYNAASNALRFSYYKSSTYTGQKSIALYKYVEDFDEDAVIDAQNITVNDETYGGFSTVGNIVYAKPNNGYSLKSYTVNGATTEQNGNAFILTDITDAEIYFEFAPIEYTLYFKENGKVISTIKAAFGAEVTLPNATDSVGEFDYWAIEGTTTAAENPYVVNGNATFVAVYKSDENTGGGGATASYYEKVTATPDDWSGDYLIVYEAEDNSKIFNGALSSLDAGGNNIVVSVVDGKIEATATVNAATFTIENNGTNIKSASGYYIGNTADSNKLYASTSTKYTNDISFDADGNVTIVSGGAYLRFNSDTGDNYNRFRYYKSSSYTGQKAIQLYKLVEVSGDDAEATGKIKGAQVSVGSDLSLKYYVDLINVTDISNVVMQFTLDGKTTTVACKNENIVDGKYVFTLADIPPQAMTAEITAVLLDGDNTLATMNYTVRDNADNLLAAYPNDAKLKQFIVDMLNYGAEAQKYTEYNTGSLANAGISGTPSSVAPTEEDKMTLITTDAMTNDSPYFRAASVYFDGKNKLIIKIGNADGATLKVNGEPAVITNGTYTIEDILATQFGDVYTFELLENDEVVQTLTYSINAYAYSKWENSSVSALAQALYKYGVSAKAYADSIK